MGRCERNRAAVALLVAIVFVVLVVAATAVPETDDTLDRAKGKGKGKGKDKGRSKGGYKYDAAVTHYIPLDSDPKTGQERFFCLARGSCHYKTISCPEECPQRKPVKNRVDKGCFADCSSRCETTCKYRKGKCEGYGSICYDPRFVGGDGVMFYFHGTKGGNFALVSDDNLHINAHFMGTRPPGRTRDFTWVQALSIMFESHTLVVAAKKVAVWDDSFEALVLRYDGKDIVVPFDGEAEWRAETNDDNREVVIERTDVTNDDNREVVIERTDVTNTVKVMVSGLVEIDVKVMPITEEEDRMHGYHLPADDAFAHLETQFKFRSLSDRVEGILGQTYRPNYVSPVKKGVPMPMMGGEDRYRTSSFLSTSCGSCRFQHQSVRIADENSNADVLVQ